MAGKFGVTATKSVITTLKLGAISVTQAIAKDGYQPSDLVAFMKSETFCKQAEETLKSAALVIPELSELDFWDGLEVAKHLSDSWKDLKTEIQIASAKMKAVKQAA